MKVVILCGGYGTRIRGVANDLPKPMIPIGNKPILWHIMKLYSFYGFNEFILPLGYKGYVIKEYFCNYHKHSSDMTVDISKGEIKMHRSNSESWKITLVDTGLDTMTGGRIKRLESYIGDNQFLLTYGDGLSNVVIPDLLKFHNSHTGIVTMSSVQPAGRFGALNIDDNKITSFKEKPKGDNSWVNGGFFVCDPGVLSYISSDDTVFEQTPLEALANNEQLYTYKHNGFWHCMDTERDMKHLISLWDQNCADWAVWDNEKNSSIKYEEELQV
jgi:glucose-1-phosphate cytidylyltransferase